jgi:hypothetical protein
VETSSESITRTSSTNGKRDAQGRLQVTQKVEALFVQLQLPGGMEVTFDSANPNLESEIPQIKALLETWNAASGASHTLVLDKDDKVVEVQGSEALLEKLSDAAKQLVKKELDPEYLKLAANQERARFPDNAVRQGDNWMRTEAVRMGAGQMMTFQTRYEYQGTVEKNGKELDKIGVQAQTVKYSIDADSPSPLKVVQSDLKIASAEGTILFDRARGEAVESQNKVRIAGDMTFSINGQELPGKLDLTLESKTVQQQ